MGIAAAGWPVIARGLFGVVAGALLSRYPEFHTGGLVVAWVGAVFAAFALFFFRDPERPLPDDPSKLFSPGDGTVLSIEQEGPGEEVTIRIFLSIFNVHIQRAPCTGTIDYAEYFPGSFHAAMAKSARGNERCVIRIVPEGRPHPVSVEQIAGLIARRIECWSGEGDRLIAGERYGLIRYGSQVAVTLPSDTKVLVSVGDKVQAGLSPIAEWIN